MELHRVYPPAAERNGEPADAAQRYAPPDAAAIQLAGLAVEVGMLRDQLADARRDRDAWRDQAQRLALPKPEPEHSPEPEPRMTWWRWLRTSA